MSVYQWIFTIYVVIGLLYWIFQLFFVIRIIKAVPILSKLIPPEPDRWPKVSVIMPGRNEEDQIEHALRSRLSDDYPNLEFIIVEDRSTDRTPQIVDKLSHDNSTLKVIHITELPKGWLGKLNAMHQGCKIATGDWLLFSDADVHISTGTMKKAIAYAKSRNLDHLAILPDMWREKNPLLNLALCYALRVVLLALRIWDVENPKKKTSIGMGAFNLVNKERFLNTPGFEWIKLDVADDVALGHMIKEHGGKCSIVNGTGLVGVHLYSSFRQMFNGSEKAVFTTMGNFSLLRMIFMAIIFIVFEYSAFIALLSTGILPIRIIGMIMILFSILTHLIGNVWMRRPLWEAFFWYLITPIYAFSILRAGILGKLRGGINWKGTFYSTEELKSGKRFKM